MNIPSNIQDVLGSKLEECENHHNSNEHAKAISLFNKICLSSINNNLKIITLQRFERLYPEEACDMVSRWRDMIPFLKGEDSIKNNELLRAISGCSGISLVRRMECAVCLFNACILDMCYDAFVDIAMSEYVVVVGRVNQGEGCDILCEGGVCKNILEDHSIPTPTPQPHQPLHDEFDYIIDSVKYLFASDLPDKRKLALGALIKITKDHKIPSALRYRAILAFNSKSGLGTYMNLSKIKVPRDEEFLSEVGCLFFHDHKNEPRERILCGGLILGLPSVSAEIKSGISEELIQIGNTATQLENIRASALDVVVRLDAARAEEALSIIKKIGEEASKIKYAFSNTQNIHLFQNQAEGIIEGLLKESASASAGPPKDFFDVHIEVLENVKKNIRDVTAYTNITKALHRISIDTAVFTQNNLSIADIFVLVWTRVKSLRAEFGDEPMRRFFEELIEMEDTCSSGYFIRFANALSGFGIGFKISVRDQIISNIIGRMNAKLRDVEDEESKVKLAMADSELADEDDVEFYKMFVEKVLEGIRGELIEEFVGGEFIDQGGFDVVFAEGRGKFLG